MTEISLGKGILAGARTPDRIPACLVRRAASYKGDVGHVDVMDGRFVPNITMGPMIIGAIRPLVSEAGGLIEAHLMIVEPERHITDFANAGADIIRV